MIRAFSIRKTDKSSTIPVGTPPSWIDTIQNAELWAVQMALTHVVFPECLYTDCDSVRLGVRKSLSWAQSSKRRYARIWSALANQLEDNAEVVHWMPAHIPQSEIGQAIASTGEHVSEDMWCANQIVDLLAKDGADLVRYPSSDRQYVLSIESKVKELAIFLVRRWLRDQQCVDLSGDAGQVALLGQGRV